MAGAEDAASEVLHVLKACTSSIGMGYAGKNMSDLYDNIKEDASFRRKRAEPRLSDSRCSQ